MRQILGIYTSAVNNPDNCRVVMIRGIWILFFPDEENCRSTWVVARLKNT